jgi:hypothetical protein
VQEGYEKTYLQYQEAKQRFPNLSQTSGYIEALVCDFHLNFSPIERYEILTQCIGLNLPTITIHLNEEAVENLWRKISSEPENCTADKTDDLYEQYLGSNNILVFRAADAACKAKSFPAMQAAIKAVLPDADL